MKIGFGATPMFVVVPTFGGLPRHIEFLVMSDEYGVHSIVMMPACRSSNSRLNSIPQPCLSEPLALQAPSHLQHHGEECPNECADVRV